MNYVKVIFGICCFFIIVFCTYYGIASVLGNFIEDTELKALVSFFGMLMVIGGYDRLEKEWRHY